jgi:hypothetical protein
MKRFIPVALVIGLTIAACDNSSSSTTPTTGATVTVTLTSAVETFPNGQLNPTVFVGLALGSPIGMTCTLPPGSTPTPAQAGFTAPTTLNPGTYCIQVSDTTIQTGPVAYTVVVMITTATGANSSTPLSGTVPAAVNGVAQSAFNTFTVGS